MKLHSHSYALGFRALNACALILLSLSAGARGDGLKPRLEKMIRTSGISRQSLGLSVLELSQGPPTQVFSLNETNDFIPASVTKLATAGAVLQNLGSTFKFQTQLLSNAAVKDDILNGDLVLKGGGDAGFISETMWYLVNEFTRTGIKKIQGDLVVDETAFDSIRTDPSRITERVDRAYDAPIGAMSFNWNSINIFVRPTQVGQKAQVLLDPLRDYFHVENHAETVSGSGVDLQISRVGETVQVRGHIGVNHDEFVAYKNVDDPADWSGKNLVFFLSQRGISVSGKVKLGKAPADARLLAKADSKPVSQSISDMMKFSNNYVAEMLTKALAFVEASDAQPPTPHAQTVPPATMQEGMKLIQQYLIDEVHLDPKHFTLLNPSGLSRHNRIRARDLAEVLVQARNHFPTFGETLAALSIAGEDGTLKKRMKGTAAEGWVRAKTGTMAGIVGLAGYAGGRDGTLRAFAFLFNGKADKGESVRHLFDVLAGALVQ